MKKLIFLLFASIIVCMAFISPPEDYRDIYVGRYFCTSRCQSLNSDYTELSYHNDTVTILVTKNTRDSVLNISIRGGSHELKLISNILRPAMRGSRDHGKFFSNDSIIFSSSPGLGPNGCSFKGKKQ